MLVPKLTFKYRSGLYRYFVCTESDCTDTDFQCTETGCTEKHVPKVYVPKLSCTESDLPPVNVMQKLIRLQIAKRSTALQRYYYKIHAGLALLPVVTDSDGIRVGYQPTKTKVCHDKCIGQ